MALLEVCCFRPQDAITAFRAGADRIELCDNREAGGTTPPLEWVKEVWLADAAGVVGYDMLPSPQGVRARLCRGSIVKRSDVAGSDGP